MTLAFEDPRLLEMLDKQSDLEIDQLKFGIIGFGRDGLVRRYNTEESRAAGLSPDRVIGSNLFTVVAPCMNNFLVAQRFIEAQESRADLDDVIDYVLTLRMRPTRVRLRLLASVGSDMQYIAVQR